jgi:hypothetical protein
MKPKHTPGPWWIDGTTIRKDIGDTGYPVAELSDWAEETESNARLIAASPELLSALKAAQVLLCDHYCYKNRNGWEPEHTDECKRAMAAIAKAEGKE